MHALLEAKVLGWLQPPPLTAAYPVTVSPWLCFYLSTLYPFLAACSCSPARPVIHSPQSVLLLLALLTSLVPLSARGSLCPKNNEVLKEQVE
jgi:hypothetical protein